MKSFVAFAVGTTLAAGAAASPVPDAFTAFVVAGDSLSDPGNLYSFTLGGPVVIPEIPLPPSDQIPRYYMGRFSNGPVWADFVGTAFAGAGKPVFNTAFGTSGALENTSTPIDQLVPDLPQQIGILSQYAAGFGTAALGVVWTGANDLFRYVEQDGPTPEEAAAGLLGGLAGLASLGVESIVAFTVPDIGRIPRYALYQPDLVTEATVASQRFNQTLLAGLSAFDPPGVDVDVFRIDRLFDDFLDDPAAYGITETATPCIEPQIFPGIPPVYTPFNPSPPPAAICSDPSGYAFFDANHPSATIQAAIADEFVSFVDRAAVVPLPSALPLLLGAIALMIPARWRCGRH